MNWTDLTMVKQYVKAVLKPITELHEETDMSCEIIRHITAYR